MSELKTAYELALPREQTEEESYIPEFVTDFKFPGKDGFVPVNIDGEDEPERETILPIPQKSNEESSIKVQIEQPESITYGDKFMEAHWYGDFLSYTGFSRMNRSMVFGLSNRMVRIKIEQANPNGTTVNQATQAQLEFLQNNVISPRAPKIYGATVPLSFMHEGRKILYTMIETSGKVHADYAGKLNLFDEIWVPTEYGRKILSASKVHPQIHVMPLGVDISRYNTEIDKRKVDGIPSMNGFVFLSVFRWSYRKGFDLLLRAYLEEFSGKDDVSLLLVSRALDVPEQQSAKRIAEDFNGIRSCINKNDDELPHVALYVKPIPESKMPLLYKQADAFALMSRGEGFGLPYCEAGACGLPVIATHCSGHSDFIRDDTAFVVEPEGYETATISGNLSRMAKLCHFYEGQEFPVFGRQSIEKIKEHMRYIVENYSEAQKKARKLQSVIWNNYTWEMAVDRVYARLKIIAD
ncbi:MAG: glycosyltransferase [Methanomassiliicoccales archaeon]|jgi:glycosyltransferase involved in cell wall biosynthesis